MKTIFDFLPSRSVFLLALMALGAGCAFPLGAQGGTLSQAELTRIHGKVRLLGGADGKRPAALRDVVPSGCAVETGSDSRAEVKFADGTLARLAPNTHFASRTGTREMDLSSGAVLFQIPKGVGGTRINTTAVTAGIYGATGFVECVAGTFKLVLLEGIVRVHLRDHARESMLMHGGQMLIAPARATTMKDWSTVDFDVSKAIKTSALLRGDLFDPLPSKAVALIDRVIQNQRNKIAGRELNPTNLVIAGGLSTVILADEASRDLEETTPAAAPRPISTAAPRPQR